MVTPPYARHSLAVRTRGSRGATALRRERYRRSRPPEPANGGEPARLWADAVLPRAPERLHRAGDRLLSAGDSLGSRKPVTPLHHRFSRTSLPDVAGTACSAPTTRPGPSSTGRSRRRRVGVDWDGRGRRLNESPRSSGRIGWSVRPPGGHSRTGGRKATEPMSRRPSVGNSPTGVGAKPDTNGTGRPSPEDSWPPRPAGGGGEACKQRGDDQGGPRCPALVDRSGPGASTAPTFDTRTKVTPRWITRRAASCQDGPPGQPTPSPGLRSPSL